MSETRTFTKDQLAAALRELVAEMAPDYHAYGLIKHHADPNDKTGWHVAKSIETCGDPLCVEAVRLLAAALPESADEGLRRRVTALVAEWSGDDAALWREQVPYLVRTEVVDRLREALDGESARTPDPAGPQQDGVRGARGPQPRHRGRLDRGPGATPEHGYPAMTPIPVFEWIEPRPDDWEPLLGARIASVVSGLHAIRYVLNAADDLGAAWAEAEAALPEGWRLAVQRTDEDFAVWAATGISAAFFEGENENEYADGQGPTPAAALRALAAKLRDRP